MRERLTDRDVADLGDAYREGTTAAQLATRYGISLKSVKRLLQANGVRRSA